MKTKHIYHISYSMLLAMAVLTSCNKYLDVAPSKNASVEISSTQDLDALMNDYTGLGEEKNLGLFGTDDWEISKTMWDRMGGNYYSQSNCLYAVWDRQYSPQIADPGWTMEFKKIFTANLILSSLSKVSGTDADKGRLKADAHFLRAYSYWVLANTYCLPYNEANRNELGLPLKLSTSFEEDVTRVPLSRVYQQIEEDLQEALKVTDPLLQAGVLRNWRANVAGVNAFAARFYLHMGDYAEAERYAGLSLNAYSTLVDYNAELSTVFSIPYVLDAGTPSQQTFLVNLPSTYLTTQGANFVSWKEFTYFRFQFVGTAFVPPSEELTALYDRTDDHDLRYYYHSIEGTTFILNNTVKPSFNWSSYGHYFMSGLITGPTVAEAILTRAEALARMDRYPEALSTVNVLRAKRMKPGTWVNLTASTKAEAITKILEERRREMPFVNRWFDLRRLNNNEDNSDDKVLTREFYDLDLNTVYTDRPLKTYTLDKKSRKYALPIPNTDIISGQGTIQQNTY